MNKISKIQHCFLLLFCLFAMSAFAEDGRRLWLPNPSNAKADVSGVQGLAMDELRANWQGNPVELKRQKGMPKEGYRITTANGRVQISAGSDAGLLYGAYHLLRLQQTGTLSETMDVTESPTYELRILDHWALPCSRNSEKCDIRHFFLHKNKKQKQRTIQHRKN